MILALVPKRDLGMWQRAATMLPASWMLEVHSHEDGADWQGLTHCSVLLKVQGSTSALEDVVGLGRTSLAMAVSLDCGSSRVEDLRYVSVSGDFRAERYGGYSICCLPMQVSVARSLGVEPKMPAPTTGPGALSDDGSLVLWPTAMFEGLGVRVSRDEKSVVAAVYEASRGDGPLWVRPGYPFLISSSPQTFRALDTGNPVQGLLCTSVRRAGGWVVLTRSDVLALLGHPGDVPWNQLSQIIGVQPAAAILGWLCSSAAALTSRSVNAG